MVEILDDIRVTKYKDGKDMKLEIISEYPREPEHIAELLRQAVVVIVHSQPISNAVKESANRSGEARRG